MKGNGHRWLGFVLLFAAAIEQGGCAARSVGPADPLTEARHRLVENPADPRTQLLLSELYLQQRDYLRARQYLQLAERGLQLERPPELALDRVFRLAITIAVRSQQYSEAIRRCHSRLEQREEASVRALLASLLEATGDEPGAEKNLRLLIEQEPSEPQRLVELARFYERSRIVDRRRLSRELYERYLERAPAGTEAPQARAALVLDDLEQRTRSIP